MIKLFLIINNLGKVRISKFYENINVDKQNDIIQKLFELVKYPDGRKSHFVKDKDGIYDKKCTIIIRQYASLHFIMIIDQDESELSALDLIQIIVEGCDTLFENVCELDMVYFPDKINALIDEIIIGGCVIETKISEVLQSLNQAQEYEIKS
ncbi:clathrin adaptor complex small chain (macronuclear) [Tetrahymena thermophila SB210]|uniref:AP complex subunit sigma n=1 Tax=Tetrahymena thermophila (strain SB210) TaxID=312017 RepID=W7XFF6_TETTS|nr:clathrin adaptor complex small chain [Tetrahymena thermophila SB210]EWS71524.1 clathrin adaptor complex small chain [Tetrahymena thermophila SB210]|eukprot:XP_012655935.1 clathrin adaptor complex small chain [Tetrahymena thermophila SB210]